MMDHDDIEFASLIEQYATGRLAEDATLAFEEHLLDCPECIERVEAAERLQRGLASVVAEDATTLGVLSTAGMLARRRRRMAWAATLVILVAGMAVLGVLFFERGEENERLRGELRLAQETVRQSVERGNGEVADPVVADPVVDPSVAALEGRLAEARAALAVAVEERQGLAEALEGWKAPVANLPIALLTPLRGDGDTSADAFGVELPPSGRWTGLWIELGGEGFAHYRAELFDPAGERVWWGGELRFNALGALFVQLPVELLHPGHWTLELAGVDAAGARPVPVASFRLAVRAQS